jgi:hypothetical protein
MKTVFVAAALALTTMSVSANNKTAQNKVNVVTENSFEETFGKVKDVNWTPAANNMLRATFTQNDETISAFFDQNGAFIASTINRTKDELPAKLRAAINSKEKDGVIIEALELQGDEEQSYYVKVYSNGVEKVYKGSGSGLIQLVKF